MWLLGEEEEASQYTYEITAFKGNTKYVLTHRILVIDALRLLVDVAYNSKQRIISFSVHFLLMEVVRTIFGSDGWLGAGLGVPLRRCGGNINIFLLSSDMCTAARSHRSEHPTMKLYRRVSVGNSALYSAPHLPAIYFL